LKIAFAGKGGSGKTTLSALFVRHLAARGLPVVAIDADINQHLAEALDAAAPMPLGGHLPQVKEYLRGTNPRIGSAAEMVKTTPPGHGSRLLRVGGPDPVHALGVDAPCGARLLATGPFADDDLGVACYHAKTGAVELYLNHLADGPGEYVVVDCTAGADSFASGLFTRFDLTVLVAEPTRRGVSVYRQWRDYADGYDVALVVAGNKVAGGEEERAADLEFLRAAAGDDLVTWFGQEPAVRAMEQGRPLDAGRLSPATRASLDVLLAALDARPRDRSRYAAQAAEFHRKNARSWANAATGTDLAGRIRPRRRRYDVTWSPAGPPPSVSLEVAG
jgi:CO dehydrogenase maturation factor